MDIFIKADIAEYQRRISYCNKIINETIRKKEVYQQRLKEKRRMLK